MSFRPSAIRRHLFLTSLSDKGLFVYRFAFAILLAAAPCCGQAFNPNEKKDGAHHGTYNAGRVADLPQGKRLKFTVVLSPNWRNRQHEYAVATWMTAGGRINGNVRSADPRLRRFQDECDYVYYLSTDPLFTKTGLAQAVGTATPIVCLTAPDGEVGRGALLNAKTCPKTINELVDMLNIAAEQLNPPPQFEGQKEVSHFVTESGAPVNLPVAQPCPDGNCEPDTSVAPAPIDGTVPSVVPRRPIQQQILPIVLALLAVGGVAVGVSARNGTLKLPSLSDDRL